MAFKTREDYYNDLRAMRPNVFKNGKFIEDLVTDPATQEKQLVVSDAQLDSVPSACYISCGAIAQEEVVAYGEYLKQWGIEIYGTWNETQDTYQLLANSGNSAMMVEWTEEETLLYLAEPVGCLIPELYLYAMTAE